MGECNKLSRAEKIKTMSRFLDGKKGVFKTNITIIREQNNPAIDNLLEKKQQINWAFFISLKRTATIRKLHDDEVIQRIELIRNKIPNSIIYEGDRFVEDNHGLLVLGINKTDAIKFGIEIGLSIIVGTKGDKSEFIRDGDLKKQLTKEEFIKMSDQQRLSMFMQRSTTDEPTEYDELLKQWWLNRY